MAARCRPAVIYSPPRLIPQLPDEISIRCIALVPRNLYPTLALVSRSWRSLFNSPLFLFKVRSDLGLSHPFLCINTSPNRFYLLDLLHPQNPSPPLCLPLPPILKFGSACAAVGHSLFVLGGHSTSDSSPSRHVQIFDAHLNRWSIGPQMLVARIYHAVWVIGDRIFVAGGCSWRSDSWAEVLDLQLGYWSTVPTPAHIRQKLMFKCTVLGGKLLAVPLSGDGVVFDPEAEPAWSDMPAQIRHGWLGRATAVDDVLYAFDSTHKICGYDATAAKWKQVEGWDKKLPDLKRTWVGNVRGVLCVIWEDWCRDSHQTRKMLVGIKVSRKNCGGFVGSIVWTDSALPIFLQESHVTDCMALEF